MTNYTELNAKLQGRNKNSRKVGNHTHAVRNADNSIGIRLHGTQVVVFLEDGRVVLNSGRWRTVATKARMNEFIPKPWKVFQKDFDWFLHNYENGDVLAFNDGMDVPVAVAVQS